MWAPYSGRVVEPQSRDSVKMGVCGEDLAVSMQFVTTNNVWRDGFHAVRSLTPVPPQHPI